MNLLLILLLCTADIRITHSLEMPISSKDKMVIGEPINLSCGTPQLNETVGMHTDKVTRITFTKLDDRDSQAGSPVVFKVDLNVLKHGDERFEGVSSLPFTLEFETEFVCMDMFCNSSIWTWSKGDYWLMNFTAVIANCHHMGLYECQVAQSKVTDSRLKYLGTEDQTPTLTMKAKDNPLKQGSLITMSCVTIRSARHVVLNFKIQPKNSNETYYLPFNLSEVDDGLKGTWPERDNVTSYTALASKTCDGNNYFTQYSELTFRFGPDFLCESTISCEANSTYTGESIWASGVEKGYTEYHSQSIKLSRCDFPKNILHTIKTKELVLDGISTEDPNSKSSNMSAKGEVTPEYYFEERDATEDDQYTYLVTKMEDNPKLTIPRLAASKSEAAEGSEGSPAARSFQIMVGVLIVASLATLLASVLYFGNEPMDEYAESEESTTKSGSDTKTLQSDQASQEKSEGGSQHSGSQHNDLQQTGSQQKLKGSQKKGSKKKTKKNA